MKFFFNREIEKELKELATVDNLFVFDCSVEKDVHFVASTELEILTQIEMRIYHSQILEKVVQISRLAD
jgi:hypothetical protein